MKFLQPKAINFFLVFSVIALAGCSKESFFGSKDGPDAFLATENAPLTPLQAGDLNAPLPKPVPGYLPPDKKAVQKVENVNEIFNANKTDAPFSAEEKLKRNLSQKLTGGLVAPGAVDIENIDKELTAIYAEEQKNISVLEQWAGAKAKPDPVIDTEEEQERLNKIMKSQPAAALPKKRDSSVISVPVSSNKPKPNRNETGLE